MTYRVEVIADASGKYCSNQLTFATKQEAAAYARDLEMRWFAVRQTRIVEIVDTINQEHDHEHQA